MKIKNTLICLLLISGSVLAVNVSGKLKFKSLQDPFPAIEQLSEAVRIKLPSDSLITIVEENVSLEILTYLRFCLIPQKVQFSHSLQPGLCLIAAADKEEFLIRQKIDTLPFVDFLWSQQSGPYTLILVAVHEQ